MLGGCVGGWKLGIAGAGDEVRRTLDPWLVLVGASKGCRSGGRAGRM